MKKSSMKIKFFSWLTLVLLSWVPALLAGPVELTGGAEPIRVVCVGDSITAGSGTTKQNSYPEQLGRMLGEKWVVINCGVGGSTLLNHGDKPYQKQAAFKRALESKPRVVVIKLGTNDTKPQNWKFKEEFISDYKDLIGQFARLPEKPRIFICHPAFVTDAGKYGIDEARVLEEIPMIDKIASEERADVIDIHGALKDHPKMFPDHVHPNNQGATVMAQTVFKALTGQEFTGPAPLVIAEPKPQ